MNLTFISGDKEYRTKKWIFSVKCKQIVQRGVSQNVNSNADFACQKCLGFCENHLSSTLQTSQHHRSGITSSLGKFLRQFFVDLITFETYRHRGKLLQIMSSKANICFRGERTKMDVGRANERKVRKARAMMRSSRRRSRWRSWSRRGRRSRWRSRWRSSR